MMNAWVLRDINELVYEKKEVPTPKDDEVRIKVMAAGICGSDIPRIYETGAHKMPLVCGHEFSGVVEGIGRNVSPYWMNKRVAVFPKIACGKCRQCRNGHPDRCENYDYSGSRRDGAFAEYVSVPMTQLLELPQSVSFEQAAMIEPMAVAANAMRTGCFRGGAPIEKEQPVAVCGLGTIGLLLVMFLKEYGYQNIYLIGNKESQKEYAMRFGVTEDRFFNINSGNPVLWLKDAGEPFVYFECVGSNESISYGMDSVAIGGRIILVGNPRSDMTFEKDTYWNILRKQITISGIWNSTFRQSVSEYCEDSIDDWNYVLKKLECGNIHPEMLITHRFSLKDLEKGFHIMRDKSEYYCKIIYKEE